MRNEEILERVGLTKGEIRVYLTLNTLGEATVGPIGAKSKVSKSKIYDILDKLIEKGLVGYITRNGTKHFTANDPQMILEYLNQQENVLKKTMHDVNEALPTLLAQRMSFTEKKIAEIYEGFHGIRAIREELMKTFKTDDTLLVIGAPRIANVRWEGWFLDFHRRRITNGIKMRIIYNADAKQYGSIREAMALTEVRYFGDGMVSPNWIDVFPETVLFIMVLATPIAFVVRDADLAKSFLSYFEILWKNAKG
ncbi:MAG: helix-turn-helix domain-containing protein [Nanoarchaeota archaeon]